MGIIKLPEKSKEYFFENVKEIFDTGNLAEGPWAEKISEKIKSISNVSHAIPTSSNGSGLVALLHIYSHYYGRKNVLIQTNTMYGVKTMVQTGGCKLAGYISCSIHSLMPTIDDVKKAVLDYNGDPNELIIMLSDIGGIVNPDAEKIATFCKQKNIIFLEDCAHSLGSELNGKSSGTFGDAGVYSFYATKAVFAGEGGVVITNNDDIASLIKGYVIYDRFDQKMPIGVNIRPSEVQSLLIYSVLNEYKSIISNKLAVAAKYMELCKKFDISFIDQSSTNLLGNYYKFIITSTNKPIKELYPNILTTTSAVYDYSIGPKNPLAEYHLCLPIWYDQNEEITNKVCNEIEGQFN